MSFHICIKTNQTLQQLAVAIRDLLSLPSFTENAFAGEPYCQFEMFGMLALIHQTDEEDRDPEVQDYLYSFDLQMAFTDHELDTDTLEYRLQPYYARLLTFTLGLDTAYHEKQKNGKQWQIRYQFLSKNPRWDGARLYGEEGWEPAVLAAPPSAWRTMHRLF
jgi:hypothetical protein